MIPDMAGRALVSGPAAETAGAQEIGRENTVLRRLIAVYRHLSALASQNADIGAVTSLIAEHTEATVAVVDHELGVLAAAAPGQTAEDAALHVRENVALPQLDQVLTATDASRRPLRVPGSGGPPVGSADNSTAVIVAPIVVGDDVPAYVLTVDAGADGPGEDTSLLLTEHAATICGIILGRERVVSAAAGRVRDDLVEGLLSGWAREEDDNERWARHLGYDTGHDHHVLSVAVEVDGDGAEDAGTGLRHRACAAAERFFATRAPEAIVSVRGAEVVAVLRDTPDDARSRADRLGGMCVDRLAEQFPAAAVTIGIGGVCRAPAEIARSYAQARRTVETVRRMGRSGQVVAFEDLGIRRLLLQVPDLTELRTFASEVLGGLGASEREHLATLACYFRENNSPQRASRILHVHPNTVTYRIRRFEEFSGLDLDNYRDRLMAQVALEIHDAVGTGEDHE